MLQRITALLIVSLGFVSTASAGNPCPIQFDIHETILPWIDEAKAIEMRRSNDDWLGASSVFKDGGIHISKVHPRHSKNKAGLKAGDIIVASNAKPIASLPSFFKSLKIGVAVELTVKRGGAESRVSFTPGNRDRVASGIFKMHSDDDCLALEPVPTSEKLTAAIHDVVLKNKRFQCSDAHLALAKMAPFNEFTNRSLVFVRGTRRILLSVPGTKLGKTICINSSDYQGSSLSNKRMEKLFYKVAGPTIDDRWDNP